MGLWLTAPELEELTGYKTLKRQRDALARMNISFTSRALDGFPLVSRAQFEDVRTVLKQRQNKRKPNLDFLRG